MKTVAVLFYFVCLEFFLDREMDAQLKGALSVSLGLTGQDQIILHPNCC